MHTYDPSPATVKFSIQRNLFIHRYLECFHEKEFFICLGEKLGLTLTFHSAFQRKVGKKYRLLFFMKLTLLSLSQSENIAYSYVCF